MSISVSVQQRRSRLVLEIAQGGATLKSSRLFRPSFIAPEIRPMADAIAKKAIDNIQSVLSKVTAYIYSDGPSREATSDHEITYYHSLMSACLSRWLPCEGYFPPITAAVPRFRLDDMYGQLKALLDDYQEDCAGSLRELVHGAVFTEFLEMGEHLLESGYKDAAAVIVGTTLEEHLRKLCQKHGIPTDLPSNGKPKKLDQLNNDLEAGGVYNLNDKKLVTAWAGIRNSAAHGKYADYTAEHVTNMVAGIKLFLSKYPA